MAAILNSAIMDSAICTKKLHLFILTQLDNGSHLEYCHVGFSHLHKKNFTCSFWLNLMMAAILNSAILDLAILYKKSSFVHSDSTWWWQASLIPPSSIQPFCTKFWPKLVQSDSNSFILNQLDDISNLEFCHLGFRHCHLGFKHLVIFSQIHSKTLFLHSDPDSN